MRLVEDPCQNWAVFRMINQNNADTSAQISVLETSKGPRIYCCESVNVQDMAGNPHVLCAGIDLNPVLDTQGRAASELAGSLKEACVKGGGNAEIPAAIRKDLLSAAGILNIGWIQRGINNPARVICSRGSVCPRTPGCYPAIDSPDTLSVMEKMQQAIRLEC